MKERVVRITKTILGFTAKEILGMIRKSNPLLDSVRVDFDWPLNDYEPQADEVVIEMSYETTEVVKDER